jgi:hypothetical protein
VTLPFGVGLAEVPARLRIDSLDDLERRDLWLHRSE